MQKRCGFCLAAAGGLTPGLGAMIREGHHEKPFIRAQTKSPSLCFVVVVEEEEEEDGRGDGEGEDADEDGVREGMFGI